MPWPRSFSVALVSPTIVSNAQADVIRLERQLNVYLGSPGVLSDISKGLLAYPDWDLLRDAFVASQGLGVLRFDDRQALKEIEGVMEVILRAIRNHWRQIPPNPPFRKGGDRIGAPLPSEGSVRGDGLRSCSF